MKVILTQDIRGTGKKGDIKEVAEGYARNFLIPRKLAVFADDKNMNILKDATRREDIKQKNDLSEAQLLAKQLENIELKFKVKLGKEGKIFGAISSKQISTELKKVVGLTIDKRKILLPEAIKNLGVTNVKIKLHPEVSVQVKVNLAKE